MNTSRRVRSGMAAPLEIIVFLLVWAGSLAQHVRVEPNVSGFVGSQVLLRCQFLDPAHEDQVTQVSWVKDPTGAKINLAVHNPSHGTHYPEETVGRITFRNPGLDDATLVINPLEMGDDGIYSCEFATYPEGNQEATSNLTVLARPVNSGSALLVRASETPVPVAVCESKGGKPPATIAWVGGVAAGGNATSRTVRATDGTFTVTGNLLAVPSASLDGQQVECVVTQIALEQPHNIPITLAVQYPPIVTIEGYDGDWFLNREHASITCSVKANPTVDKYKWSMNGEKMPSSVRVERHQLTVDTVSYKVNGTFTCEATNSLGTSRGSLDILVREVPLQSGSTTGAIVGGIIAAIVILTVLVTAFLIFRRQRKNKQEAKADEDMQPPSYKPPPPKVVLDDAGKTENEHLMESIPLRSEYFETNGEDGSEMKLAHEYSEEGEEDLKLPLGPEMGEYRENVNPIYDEGGEHRKSQEFMSTTMYV